MISNNGPAGRVALVTGAAQGIGRAIAERLARDGARLVLVDLQLQALDELVAQLKARGSDAIGIAGDVSCPTIATQAAGQFGGVDILVNNAGISPKHDGVKATLTQMSLEEWRRVLDVNLTSAFM